MNMKMVSGIFILSLGVICNISRVFATEDEAVVATLLVPKTAIQGEPLPVRIRVINNSKRDLQILIPEVRRFGPDTILFGVQAPGSHQMRAVQRPDIYIGGFKNMPPSALPVKRLSPGESVEYAFSLIYDFPDAQRRKKLFETPGQYVVQATIFELVDISENAQNVPYDAKRRAIEAETVVTEIISPESQRDKEALNAMWALPDEYLVYDPFVFRADCHAKSAEKILEYFSSYSDTIYGQRAALPLGIAVAAGIVRDDSGIIHKAIESLSAKKQLPVHTVASAVLKEMANRKRQ